MLFATTNIFAICENKSIWIDDNTNDNNIFDCNGKFLYREINNTEQITINHFDGIVDTDIIQAEFIYTKSKVPSITGKYFNLFNNSIFNKLTHFAYKVINGKGIIDAEERWMGAEGYLACDRKCTLQSNKWDDYKICKVNC